MPTFLECNRIQCIEPPHSLPGSMPVGGGDDGPNVTSLRALPGVPHLLSHSVSVLFPTCTCRHDYAVSLNITEADEAYLKKLFQ